MDRHIKPNNTAIQISNASFRLRESISGLDKLSDEEAESLIAKSRETFFDTIVQLYKKNPLEVETILGKMKIPENNSISASIIAGTYFQLKAFAQYQNILENGPSREKIKPASSPNQRIPS
jgi:hypothetical protein